MNIDGLVRALHARKSGSSWMAHCHVHGADGGDRNPSVAIRQKDGKILIHCHAGCAQRDVIAALRARGLWESEKREPRMEVVATYDYCDERGVLLYQVVRTNPKGFLQ